MTDTASERARGALHSQQPLRVRFRDSGTFTIMLFDALSTANTRLGLLSEDERAEQQPQSGAEGNSQAERRWRPDNASTVMEPASDRRQWPFILNHFRVNFTVHSTAAARAGAGAPVQQQAAALTPGRHPRTQV